MTVSTYDFTGDDIGAAFTPGKPCTDYRELEIPEGVRKVLKPGCLINYTLAANTVTWTVHDPEGKQVYP